MGASRLALNLCLATGLGVLLLASPARSMDFTVIRGGLCAARSCVLARGSIDERTGDEFKAFVQRHHLGQGSLIVLDSGGGIVRQGLELGAYIRRAGFSTHVQGPNATCASACVYAYLGGLERTVGDGGRIGVHQMSQTAGVGPADSADSQAMLGQIAAHLRRMGAALDLLGVALRTPPERVHWLSVAELSRFRVISD